ncbi:MAG: gamma-glutamylcyclotransferase family protein [Akkermansiaceae bacterium]
MKKPVSERIFVYGALRRGASNHWRMEGAKFLGEATVTGTLVKVDWYPGLVLDGVTQVLGEVYEVSANLLAELDDFEGLTNGGLFDEYDRVIARVEVGGQPLEASIYEWQKGVAGYEVVENGDWLTEGASR